MQATVTERRHDPCSIRPEPVDEADPDRLPSRSGKPKLRTAGRPCSIPTSHQLRLPSRTSPELAMPRTGRDPDARERRPTPRRRGRRGANALAPAGGCWRLPILAARRKVSASGAVFGSISSAPVVRVPVLSKTTVSTVARRFPARWPI